MRSKVSIARPTAPGVGRRDFVKATGVAAVGLAQREQALTADQLPGFQSNWQGSRVWVGKEYWANPLQDWRVDDGEVVARAAGRRTLHLLTHQVTESGGGLEMEVTVRLVSPEPGNAAVSRTWAGFAVGIRGGLPGYQHALVHPGPSLAAGVRGDGRVSAAIAWASPCRLILRCAWSARARGGFGVRGRSVRASRCGRRSG